MHATWPMRSRPNARHIMPIGDESSTLFHDEEQPMHMRRRPVPQTQMGEPRLRRNKAKHRPVFEWTKAILICVLPVLGFLSFVRVKKSRHELRKSANFEELDRCNLSTYPLWQIGQLEELNLSACELTDLPDDSELWSRFSSLKKIDLNSNALADLPDAFGVLPSLEILFLSDNSFQQVPEAVGRLKKLRLLSLKGNLLGELSTSNLPTASLVWLILTNNKIARIDPNVGELKHLRKLMLSHNEIDIVPSELGKCKELELVRLANNKIQSMPKEVLTLPKLAWISLSGNPMIASAPAVEKVIHESDIEMSTKELGKGASGTVFQGKYNGKDVAVKMFKEASKGSDGLAADEAAINGLIDYPLAISAIGVIPMDGDSAGYKGMVMELLEGVSPLGKVPSFDTVTRDEGPALQAEGLSQEQVWSAIWNLACALEYIHSSLGVSHGDIYLHNTLRDGADVARISDWGASFVYRKDVETASMFERIEVLAFGHLIEDLYSWHLKTSVPDQLNSGPLKDLFKTILHLDQSKRPDFHTIRKKLEGMAMFKEQLWYPIPVARKDDNSERFIVVENPVMAQGVGSMIKGLLMAVDLGHEYNRIVCVEWKAFLAAFNPPHEEMCRNLTGTSEKVEYNNQWSGRTNTLEEVQKAMASDVKIIRHTGNHQQKEKYEPELYEGMFVPTKALKEKIPWKEAPKCVIHLRRGDSKRDVRQGLDEETLQVMEKELESDCYLITNNIEWYGRFEKAGWGHPPWNTAQKHQMAFSMKELEPWVDWYTAMQAERLYHNPSTFSESASWAGGSVSRKIVGSENGSLLLEPDSQVQLDHEKKAGLA